MIEHSTTTHINAPRSAVWGEVERVLKEDYPGEVTLVGGEELEEGLEIRTDVALLAYHGLLVCRVKRFDDIDNATHMHLDIDADASTLPIKNGSGLWVTTTSIGTENQHTSLQVSYALKAAGGLCGRGAEMLVAAPLREKLNSALGKFTAKIFEHDNKAA